MIDYDKLRIANDDLLQHLKNMESTQRNYLKCMKREDDAYTYGHAEGYMMCYQEVIDKIESLTQPKAKYEVGQMLHFIDYSNNKYQENIRIMEMPVISIDYDLDSIRYFFSGDYGWEIKEEDLYPAKSALIEAQIEYWTKIKIDEISASKTCSKCGMQRMKDGICWSMQCSLPLVPFEGEAKGFNEKRYPEGILPNPSQLMKCHHESDSYISGYMNKCLKCGEFYR